MAANPAVKKSGISVRNLAYIHGDDPRYHEAITDLQTHIELLKFTVEKQAAELERLKTGK